MTLTRFFIAAFIFLGTTISAADFVETSNSVNEPELVLELNRLLQTPDSFDRALRQKKTVLPQRLLDAQRDRMRDITFPTLYGLEEPLTQHFMEYYTRSGGLKWLAEVLESGAPYLAFIREEIAARNMPPELLYLPVIESGFVAKAYSSSGAAGFWQFMRNSIRPYMNITEWIDERYDFWKATHGALSKLQNNYNDYNSWDLALAAYNSGSGAVSNTLKKTGINDYWTLANQKLLKRESIYYVPKLIAIYYIVSNPRMFGLDLSSMPKEHLWTRINVDKQINLSMLAEYAGVDYNELRRSNSELLYNLTPPDNHLLKVKVADAEKIKAVLERDDIKLLKYYTYIIKS
ncbi:MAG: lytic transglycosylase domain-containing protein, partial [Spirochaetaceae bacterium]|nr:lytic transglycosylase domain-containing protein [Spirochaetaceae bacterium]